MQLGRSVIWMRILGIANEILYLMREIDFVAGPHSVANRFRRAVPFVVVFVACHQFVILCNSLIENRLQDWY